MWNERLKMSYRSLSGYIACLRVLLVVVFVEKGLVRKAKQTTVETYKSEYVLPEDVDTVRINTASVLELKHIGFTNYEIVSIMSSRERGFVFRNLSQLKSGRYFDTLKIDIMAHKNQVIAFFSPFARRSSRLAGKIAPAVQSPI